MPSKKPAAKSTASAPGEMIPGAPGTEPPTVAEPTEPRAVAAEAGEQPPDVTPSAALSQVGQSWPVTRRIVGDDPDLKGLRAVRKEIFAAGMVPHAPRVPLMLAEAFRHAKAIGGWGDATDALSAAGCSTDAPSVVLADSPTDALSQLTDLLGTHRVWEHFALP